MDRTEIGERAYIQLHLAGLEFGQRRLGQQQLAAHYDTHVSTILNFKNFYQFAEHMRGKVVFPWVS